MRYSKIRVAVYSCAPDVPLQGFCHGHGHTFDDHPRTAPSRRDRPAPPAGEAGRRAQRARRSADRRSASQRTARRDRLSRRSSVRRGHRLIERHLDRRRADSGDPRAAQGRVGHIRLCRGTTRSGGRNGAAPRDRASPPTAGQVRRGEPARPATSTTSATTNTTATSSSARASCARSLRRGRGRGTCSGSGSRWCSSGRWDTPTSSSTPSEA